MYHSQLDKAKSIRSQLAVIEHEQQRDSRPILWHEFPHDFAVSRRRLALPALPANRLRSVGNGRSADLVAAFALSRLGSTV